ncbi:MAG: phosphoglycerate kinase [Desulfobacterales bacterium]
MKSIKDISIDGKRVLIRVDFNVPLDEHQNITDDSRIRGVLETIRYALARHAVVILASHLGRPKGQPVAEMSLAPVANRLGRLLETEVAMAPDCVGDAVEEQVAKMSPGQVLLLENLRFHKEEQEDDDSFARSLARLCDVYINDAFAVSHRKNASVSAICRHVPVCGAGLLLKKELDYFEKAMAAPERPLAAIIGGAKVSSKLKALENMLRHVDKIIIGGAMANTFLKAAGIPTGKSMVEDDLVEAAVGIMRRAADEGIKFYLPVDAVIAVDMDREAESRTVPVQEMPEDWMALDIGPATCNLFREVLKDAKTIIWNGPMGVFEMDPFSRGTMAMAEAVAGADALTIIGGGDTDAAVHKAGASDRVSYISTGGGAFLALLEGKTLPAVAALEACQEGAGS